MDVQELSQLVTEAMKDAHAKSVQVLLAFRPPKNLRVVLQSILIYSHSMYGRPCYFERVQLRKYRAECLMVQGMKERMSTLASSLGLGGQNNPLGPGN